MDFHTAVKLKQVMFRLGDNHAVVGQLKSLLNSNPNVKTPNLQINNSFDENMQKTVAYFQKTWGLNPSGEMNFNTWLAFGSEMSPFQITGLFANDKTLQNLLGLGYVLGHPQITLASNKSSGYASVRSSSANLDDKSPWYDFTFRLFISIFAPFDWFGPLGLSAGDKLSRPFGTDPDASYRLQCFSTVTATPGDRTYDWSRTYNRAITRVSPATTSILLLPTIPIPNTTIPLIYPRIAKSQGLLRNEENPIDFSIPLADRIDHKGNQLRFGFSGNDDAFAIWGKESWLASDIDIHPEINFEYTPNKDNPKNCLMRVYGNIAGDQFPAVETFVRDKNGNGVMLGVWQVRDGDGPVFTREGLFGIVGDKNLPMIDIEVTIVVENGIFKGVVKNGRTISLAEHNEFYTNLPRIKSANSPTAPKPAPLPTPTPVK